MCKLTLSPNFSTIFRVIDFLFHYLEIYNQSTTNIKFEQLKDKVEEEKKEKEVNINDDKNINKNNNIINEINDEKESAPPIINPSLI